MQNCLRVVLACVFGMTSSFAVAGDDPELAPELRVVVEALDHLQLKYQISSDSQRIHVSYQTSRYRDFDGDHSLLMTVTSSKIAGKPWLSFTCWYLYSIVGCGYPDAARRALAGASEKLDTVAGFSYDEDDGTATMRTAIPAPADTLSPALLETILESMVGTVDALDPVMRRAMDSGMIDWQVDDDGPSNPTGTLECVLDGEKLQIGWAPWIEEDLFASSILCAGKIIEKFTKWTDVDREAFGRKLAGSFRGAPARAVYRNWVNGAQYLEQHHPTIAFRFFGPPGVEVSATARVKGFAAGEARASAVLDEMGHVDVEITPEWDVIALAKLHEETEAMVEYTVSCGATKASGRKSIAIQPPSIAELGLPSCMSVAAYVNEAHPWVKEILRETKNLGIASSLGGDTGKFDPAVPQVFAVWTALRNRGLEYVSIETTEQAEASAQHIRQFHEALVEEGANCADGTALFASVLLSLGYDVHLVTYPGHVFLGVLFEDEEGAAKEVLFLETTMLGSVEEPESTYLSKYETGMPAKFHGSEWQLFSAACEAGLDQWRQNRCVIASIKALREEGLSPLPVSGKSLGKMPPVPPKEQLAERREARRAALLAEYERDWGWMLELPTIQAVGYADLDDLVSDIGAAPTDRAAHWRLLSAIDSDEPIAMSMRAVREVFALDSALDAAMRKKFPETEGDRGTGVCCSNTQVGSADDLGDGYFLVNITDRGSDDSLLSLPVHTVKGQYFIDGTAIGEFLDETQTKGIIFIAQVVVAARKFPEPFTGSLKNLAQRVTAGSIDAKTTNKAIQDAVRTLLDTWKASREAGVNHP